MSEQGLYHGILATWFALSAVTFPSLLWFTAPYGRHARTGWGPKLSSRAGWILMEAPAVFAIAACFVATGQHGWVPLVLLGLWELHYVNRAFIFPFRMRNPAKPMPLAIAGTGLLFNLFNGYLNGRALTGLGAVYAPGWLADPRFLVGAALFLCGLVINQHADHVLLNLRKPGETGYRVPEGGLYRFISCPNYFGEILEWTGWACATWSLAGLGFALWTAANLVPRALSHHRWYRAQFPDYPAARRAIVPRLL